MAALALTAVDRRTSRALLASLLLLLPSCDNQSGDYTRQIDGLKADLDEAKRRLSHVQNSLAAKDAELAVTMTTLETMKGGLAAKEQTLGQRDSQLGAVQAELDALKKRDVFIFGEIAALQQQGQTVAARTRYEKFIVEFPKSSLVPAATSAIAQLSEGPREVRRQMDIIDPTRKDREFQKTFAAGYMTLQELAPVLKRKSLPQVLALLGRPNQTFNAGTEIGYLDRAINPLTGTRGMLVIGFESGTVATLRVEYAGKKFAP